MRESCSFNSTSFWFSSFSFFATTTSEKQTRSCTLHRNSSVHPFLINPLVLQRGLGFSLGCFFCQGRIPRPLCRTWQTQVAAERDSQVSSILEDDPRRLFAFIRSSKSGAARPIQQLSVSGKIYTGDRVADGFYDSLSSLKAPDMSSINASQSFQNFTQDYENIVKICSAGLKIPPISGKDCSLICQRSYSDQNVILYVIALYL